MYEIYELTIFFLIGISIGSFLNVCIYRIPLKQSVVLPSSHCPNCKKSIPAYFNIPIISFIYLRGRCKFCKQAISIIYVIVEIFTGLFFLYFGYIYGISFDLLLIYFLIPIFIIIFFIDIKHLIIPDILILLLFLICFLKVFISENTVIFPNFHNSIIGSLIAIFLIGGLIAFYYYVRKIEAMGLGDLKLFTTLGFIFGVKGILFIIIFSSIFGSILGSIILLKYKKNLKTELPFGPYIIVASFIYLIFAKDINEIIYTNILF